MACDTTEVRHKDKEKDGTLPLYSSLPRQLSDNDKNSCPLEKDKKKKQEQPEQGKKRTNNTMREPSLA